MERKPEVPDAPPEARFLNPKLSRPVNINSDSVNLSRTFSSSITCTSTTSSSSSSPPDLVRHVQAAFKRHRPVGMMQSNSINPRRVVTARRKNSKEANMNSQPIDSKRKEDFMKRDKPKGLMADNQVHACITPPSESSREDTYPDATQAAQAALSMLSLGSNAAASSSSDNANAVVDVTRKAHFSSPNLAESHESVESNQVDVPDVINQDKHQYGFQSMEVNNSIRSEGEIPSLVDQKTDSQHQLGNFLQKDLGNFMTQSHVVGSSYVTSTLNNSTFAPRISSTAYSSQPQTLGTYSSKKLHGEVEVKLDIVKPSCSLMKYADLDATCKSAITSQSAISFTTTIPSENNKATSEKLQSTCPLEHNASNVLPQEGTHLEESNATDTKSRLSQLDKIAPTEAVGNPKTDKFETAAAGKASSKSRKRGYDPDMFFKVNGKLYQRLGKIGSGGSSEVHKVISSDCKIYALKKIKLKGRDYATAYGFCQEIYYLNRLRGKDNIIQLIDYEVTDKTLLQEVIDGSMSKKDGRVKDDGYVYMVLEYGEIDLAHMLSQKWKELDTSGANASIDENWLRFYWQQILLAVNTIHEERIVHSDLKPANFLLVKGSLKLIDFGIAKAIMSDTTNIQRDSQVGTLSYMSPEAFLCNEVDANGILIKCGLPSDIWSLGCILYQMVYGRTPFSEYKTFMSKFKVITDPTYEIEYDSVSNLWLLDLMKKCLAWDRNKRWRIPQLLQHPFLVPPIPPELPSLGSNVQSCKLLQLITEASAGDQKTLELCSQLQNMLMVQPDLIASREHLRKLLCKVSATWNQLHEVFSNL